jgi:hypothetical protein
MQRLVVSCAVWPICGSLGAKGLMVTVKPDESQGGLVLTFVHLVTQWGISSLPSNECLSYKHSVTSWLPTAKTLNCHCIKVRCALITPRCDVSDHTWSDNKVRELAMCLPWQHWTKALVWFDDDNLSAFHMCCCWSMAVYFWVACVMVWHRKNVGAWIRAVSEL